MRARIQTTPPGTRILQASGSLHMGQPRGPEESTHCSIFRLSSGTAEQPLEPPQRAPRLLGLSAAPLFASREPSGLPLGAHAACMCVPPSTRISLRHDQDVLAECRQVPIAKRTPIRRRLLVLRPAHRPPPLSRGRRADQPPPSSAPRGRARPTVWPTATRPAIGIRPAAAAGQVSVANVIAQDDPRLASPPDPLAAADCRGRAGHGLHPWLVLAICQLLASQRTLARGAQCRRRDSNPRHADYDSAALTS
jgi:hypothetical protein